MATDMNGPCKPVSGYYWVQFPYDTGERRWEPGSFDARTGTWALIGSHQEWLSFQLVRIGPMILIPSERELEERA